MEAPPPPADFLISIHAPGTACHSRPTANLVLQTAGVVAGALKHPLPFGLVEAGGALGGSDRRGGLLQKRGPEAREALRPRPVVLAPREG
jgi:hypothetical protein